MFSKRIKAKKKIEQLSKRDIHHKQIAKETLDFMRTNPKAALAADLGFGGVYGAVEQGVVEATIKQHEEFALFALISLIILGVASIIGLFLTLRKSKLITTTAFVILAISLISFGLVARTGYLGGQIRHTEISSSNNPNSTPVEYEGDDD
jgi:phosphoglycerol transferase MdoB-like AlkP superfamily enzyme